MVFSSLEFIFYFLPIFLLIYYLVPIKWKNLILLIGSLVFYSYGVQGEPFYLVLIVFSIVVNYVIGLQIERKRSKGKVYLLLGLFYNFGWLFLFKYAAFTADNINSLTEFFVKKEIIPPFQLILPIGISFYTFQIASYLIDVYREEIPAAKSVITLGAYLCMFPQLIAGPIVTYSSVAAQLRKRTHTLKKVDEGLRLFTLGLGLKVLLANQIGKLWTDIGAVGYESISTPLAWMGIFAYSFQLYFDFYGYSLMAIGLGKLLGMNLPQNFNYPYMAVSMTDFWRRWHITLGSWFREYIYIPLGGNRQGNLKTIRNLFIVWTFTGIWHGASWNFVLWGILLFVIITLEKYVYGNILQKVPVLGHVYMLFLIPVSWSLFEITDFNQLGIYLGKLFPILGKQQTPLFAGDYIKYGKMYGIFLILGFIFSTNLPRKLYERWKDKLIASIVLLAIFWASVYCLYMGMDDPFLYFRF